MTNGDERDDAHDDPVLEWSLHERLGGERTPDLLAGVQARLRAGGPVRPAAARATNAWLAAAVVLLGLGVVFGVALWPEGSGGEVPIAPVQVQEPRPVAIDATTDIAALPANTRAVELSGANDALFARLERFHDLEVLIVREPNNEVFGLGLKTMAPPDPQHVTAAVWATVAKLSKLRRIEFRGTVCVMRSAAAGATTTTFDAERAAAAFAQLERLPLLESLTLRCMDTPDAVLAELPRLRQLRHLDLSFNHGFEEPGIHALLQCRSLRTLSLAGCQQLHGRLLARLSELPELTELELGSIDGINWRAGTAEPDDEAARAVRQHAQRLAGRIGMGPTDEALAGLARAPKLRVLDIGGGPWSAAGLSNLGGIATLRELNAFGGQVRDSSFVASLPKELERLEVCGDYTDDFCVAVAEHLKGLRHLTIAACYQITDRGLATVAAMPSLRVLDMRQMRGLTVACIDALLATKQLEELDMRHCDFVTAKHVARLKRVLPKLRKIETSVEAAAIEQEEKLPEPVVVQSEADVKALPADVRNVRVLSGSDAMLAELAKFKAIERIELSVPNLRGLTVRDDPVRWTAPRLTEVGIRELPRFPALRALRMETQTELLEVGIEVVRQLRGVIDLELVGMTVGDAALEKLSATQLRSLAIEACEGFGAIGLRAVASIRPLRSLRIARCRNVSKDALIELGAAVNLEHLELTELLGRTTTEPLGRGFSGNVTFGAMFGVTDAVLIALAPLQKLQTLAVNTGRTSKRGLSALHNLAALQSLELAGGVSDVSDLESLPYGLKRLSLSSFPAMDAELGATLARSVPALVDLDVHGSELTPKCVASLRAVRSLRSLDLSGCMVMPIDSILQVDQIETLVMRSMMGPATANGWRDADLTLPDEWTGRLREMPNLRSLVVDGFGGRPREIKFR